jgi:hypothetical protein
MAPPKQGKYPLEPARRLREDRAEAAARELAEKVRAREAADAEKARAEAARLAAEQAAAAARAKERAALERGELKVADLARQDAWSVAVQMEKRTLEKTAATAEEKARAARDTETTARGVLGEKKAEAEVLVRDQGRWTAAQAKAREAAEEEEAAEAWRPRRG